MKVWRLTGVSALLLLGMVGCGGGSDEGAGGSTEADPDKTTTTAEVTTTTSDPCRRATDEMLDFFSEALDQIAEGRQPDRTVGEIGREVGSACGATGVGASVSEGILYLLGELDRRPDSGVFFIELMLPQLCAIEEEQAHLNVQFTSAAKAVCDGL